MDYIKIKEIRGKINNLNSRLILIEELHKETLEKIKDLQESCGHELIFVNRKYENIVHEYLKYGKCLICGQGITLTPNNVDVDTKKEISKENIIDVSTKVEKWDFNCDCSLNRDEIDIAENIVNDLITNDQSLRFGEAVKHEVTKAIKTMTLTKKV